MRVFFTVFFTLFIFTINQDFCQTSSSAGIFHDLPDGLKINAYVDMYYASDNVEGNYLRQFSAIAPYRDDFKLNFASLAARYSNDNFRGNIVIHFGDVPDVNWPAPDKFIQEC